MSKVPSKIVAAVLLAALAGGSCAAASPPMVTALQKANGSGVVIRYRVDGVPKSGQPTTVTIEFSGVTDAAGASARFTSDPELTLDTATSAPVVLSQGATTSVTLRVTPSAEGRFYVNIFTAQRGAKSATSVAVQVGDKPTRAKAQAADDPDAAIVMPVD